MSTGNRRTAHVRSRGFARVLVLNKKDLHESLVDYPDAAKVLREKANSLLKQDLQRQIKNDSSGVAAAFQAEGKPTQEEEYLDVQLGGAKADTRKQKTVVPLPSSQNISVIITVEEDRVEETTCADGGSSSQTKLSEDMAGKQETNGAPTGTITNKGTAPNPVGTDFTSHSQSIQASNSPPDLSPGSSQHGQNDSAAAFAGCSSRIFVDVERVDVIDNDLGDTYSAIELPGMVDDDCSSSTNLQSHWITRKTHGLLEREPSNSELYKTGTELDMLSLSGSGTTVAGTASGPLDQECPSWIMRNKAKVGL